VNLRFIVASAVVVAIVVTVVRLTVPDAPDAVLPQGPQTLSGVLVSTPLSLDRRGTHLLRISGIDVAYVESSVVNLREFEGLHVSVQGAFEHNSDPAALPVLVASGVTLFSQPMRQWTVTPLYITLESPISWDGQTFDDGMRFSVPGTVGSVMQVYRAATTAFPQGTDMQVGGRSAVLTQGSNGPNVFVRSDTGIIAFSFSAPDGGDGSTLSPEQMLVLRSVRFTRGEQSSVSRSVISVPSSSSGAAIPVLPCGGPGGVLCPAGSYCEITDAALGIGQCRTVR